MTGAPVSGAIPRSNEEVAPHPAFGLGEAGDARMVAMVRVLLAAAGFLIIWLDPSEPGRLASLTYASLAALFLYSAGLALAVDRRPALAAHAGVHWTDVAFATHLVALTQGTNSGFFYFFFFAILSASFTRGFRHGIVITVASAVAFVVASLVALPYAPTPNVDRLAIRPVSLLLLGYMVAHWGGYELALKRRLALLHALQASGSPRLGPDRLVHEALAALRRFFDAEACLLVLRREGDALPVVYRADREAGDAATEQPRPLPQGAASGFDGLPDGPAQFPPTNRAWWRVIRFAPQSSAIDEAAARRHESAAHLLDAAAMLSAPYRASQSRLGRVFVVSRRRRAWASEDAHFLGQWAATLETLVHRAALTEELIRQAADHARRDLSRDLHDMTIQPYVGLKYALESLLRACPPELPLKRNIAETVAMAQGSIEALRTHAAEIRFGRIVSAEALAEALAGQARHMGQFFGLEVSIDCRPPGALSGRASALIHRIVTEGLNNVLRHTTARRAAVVIAEDGTALAVEIRNECGDREENDFIPLSIADRVTEVGGTVAVRRQDGMSAVLARIPLEACHAAA